MEIAYDTVDHLENSRRNSYQLSDLAPLLSHHCFGRRYLFIPNSSEQQLIIVVNSRHGRDGYTRIVEAFSFGVAMRIWFYR